MSDVRFDRRLTENDLQILWGVVQEIFSKSIRTAYHLVQTSRKRSRFSIWGSTTQMIDTLRMWGSLIYLKILWIDWWYYVYGCNFQMCNISTGYKRHQVIMHLNHWTWIYSPQNLLLKHSCRASSKLARSAWIQCITSKDLGDQGNRGSWWDESLPGN